MRSSPASTSQPPGRLRTAPVDTATVAALEAVSRPVDALLGTFLAQRCDELIAYDPALGRVGAEISGLVAATAKRLRPAFVYWGHRATGAPHREAVLAVGAAVELLHTFALIHDDIMDRSAVRRSRPAVHAALARGHVDERLTGDPAWFGVGGGILAGDLVFVWADQLLETAAAGPAALGAEPLRRARKVFTQLRVEVMAGQYLDLRLAGLDGATEADALRVALLKSGRYTVTRPLQIGQALAADSDPLLDAALTAFGDAIGIAFQLRDDVLGLFGDPVDTGKNALSDLREGKRTLLMLRAMALARPAARAELRRALGDSEVDEARADRVREIVTASGALAEVEARISERRRLAARALAPVEPPARDALAELAEFATARAR